jgi:hypothetical protein
MTPLRLGLLKTQFWNERNVKDKRQNMFCLASARSPPPPPASQTLEAILLGFFKNFIIRLNRVFYDKLFIQHQLSTKNLSFCLPPSPHLFTILLLFYQPACHQPVVSFAGDQSTSLSVHN